MSVGSAFVGGRAVAKRLIAFAKSFDSSVISCSPLASNESRVFISSHAHWKRLSIRRPLYLERSSALVPLLFAAIYPMLPESPRWLLRQGKEAAAAASVRRCGLEHTPIPAASLDNS